MVNFEVTTWKLNQQTLVLLPIVQRNACVWNADIKKPAYQETFINKKSIIQWNGHRQPGQAYQFLA